MPQASKNNNGARLSRVPLEEGGGVRIARKCALVHLPAIRGGYLPPFPGKCLLGGVGRIAPAQEPYSGGAVPRQPRRISSLRMCGWGLLTRAAETCRCRACRGAHHTALHVSACQSMTCRIYALQCIPHADADSRRGWVPLARSPPKTAMPRGVATHVCPERAAGRHEPSST